jgi:hypothetical protein
MRIVEKLEIYKKYGNKRKYRLVREVFKVPAVKPGSKYKRGGGHTQMREKFGININMFARMVTWVVGGTGPLNWSTGCL